MWPGRTMTLTGEQPRAGKTGHCRSDVEKLVGFGRRTRQVQWVHSLSPCFGPCRWADGQQRVSCAEPVTCCWPRSQRVSALQPAQPSNVTQDAGSMSGPDRRWLALA